MRSEMTSWRERLRLVNPSVARDAALHESAGASIDDLSPVAVVRNGINDTSGRVWAQVRSELVFRPEFAPGARRPLRLFPSLRDRLDG